MSWRCVNRLLVLRTTLTRLSLSCVAVAGAALLPVTAADFDNRDLTDPLDPSVYASDRPLDESSASVTLEPVDESTERLPAVRAILVPEDVKSPPVPVSAPPKPKVKIIPEVVKVITGQASWYGPGFYGNRTASGEVYRRGTMTAAHRSLPFGTKVRVTNLWNGRSAVIRINDRGPFVAHRVIDLGHGAASSLGVTGSGIADVRIEVLR